jgi:hypothetical protein
MRVHEPNLQHHPGTGRGRWLHRHGTCPTGGRDASDTREEALANARESIELVIEHRLAQGEPIPADVTPEIDKLTVDA